MYTYLGGGPTARAVTATTNVSWIATTEADWITLNTSSGSGNGQVRFTIPAKTYLYDNREADIAVSANTGEIKYIHVTQEKHPYMLLYDPNASTHDWPVPLIFQEGGFAYQLRDHWQYTRDIKIYTNEPLESVTTDNPSWSSAEYLEAFEGGYIYRINATACLNDRTFYVTFKSTNTNLPDLKPQIVQYYLEPATTSNDFIAVSTDGDWEWPSGTECTKVNFGEITAAARDLNFFVWTTAKCKIESVTGETPFQLYDMYDNRIVMSGESGGKWIFGPYGSEEYSGWINHAASVPMVLKMPTNYSGSDRYLKIKLATFFYSPSDLSWKDHAILEVTQKRMTYYDDNYNIDVFIITDIMTPFETDVTIDSSSRVSTVMAAITCTRHWSDGHVTPNTQVVGYTEGGGIVDNLIKLEVNNWAQISRDYTHEGGYYASDTNPFEVYIPANQTYDNTGNPKNMEFTLTYMGSSPWVNKTISVTQEWSKKPDEELSFFLYVDTLYGGQGNSVKEDNVNTTNSGNQKVIMFNLQSSIGTDIEYMMVTPEDYAGAFIHSDSLGYFYAPQTYPGQNHGNWIIRLRDDVTRDFTIEITANRADNTHVSTVLTLHVHIV